MKIESIGQIKEIEQIQIPGLIAPKFTEGEILIARVIQIEGGKVYLNNKNGSTFLALMQNDLGLSEGDIVEVIANGNGKGYTLNLLDVEHGQTASFDKASISVRDTVSGTLAMIKANPGLNPKTASFLVENGMTSSQENVSALSNIIHGTGIGSLLAELLTGISVDSIPYEDSNPVTSGITEKPLPEEASVLKTDGAINNKPENGSEKGTVQLMAGQRNTAVTVSNAAGESMAMAAADTYENNLAPNTALAENINGETLTAEQQNASSRQAGALQQETAGPAYASGINEGAELPKAAVTANGGFNEPANSSSQTGTTVQYLQGNTLSDAASSVLEGDLPETMLGTAATEVSAEHSKINNKEEVIQAIKDIFCRPEEQTGAELKKAVSEMNEKLDSLKLLLHNSDNRDKGVFVQKTEEAQKQLEVMTGAKKFDYVQIPFMLKDGQPRTAELYVYRRNRNQSEDGDNGITLLIAQDTENIGRIETLIKTKGSKLLLEFRLERRELQQEIKRKAKSLAQKIENAGYRLKEIRLTGLETKTTVLNAGGLLQYTGERQETIDVQI